MLITPKGEIVSEYRNDDKSMYVYIDRYKDTDGVVWWENTYTANQTILDVKVYRYEQHAENAAEDYVLGGVV